MNLTLTPALLYVGEDFFARSVEPWRIPCTQWHIRLGARPSSSSSSSSKSTASLGSPINASLDDSDSDEESGGAQKNYNIFCIYFYCIAKIIDFLKLC